MSEIGGDYYDENGNDRDNEFLDDWDNQDVENEELDDDDDDNDELPDDWDNQDVENEELDDDEDDELPNDWVNITFDDEDDELLDDWVNEDVDNKDLDKKIDVRFTKDGKREEIFNGRDNEGKLNKEGNIETSRKTIITAKSLDDQNFEKLEGKEAITPLGKPIQLKENFLTGQNLKHNKKVFNLQKVPQSQEEIKEINNKLDLSKIPQSMEELKALEDYQNKIIVENSIHRLMRMSPEQRERLGLSGEYTNHEFNIFFAQNDPPSILDSNKAKPSEVSNPENSELIFHNDLSEGKSKDLKKESVNKILEKGNDWDNKDDFSINFQEMIRKLEKAEQKIKIVNENCDSEVEIEDKNQISKEKAEQSEQIKNTYKNIKKKNQNSTIKKYNIKESKQDNSSTDNQKIFRNIAENNHKSQYFTLDFIKDLREELRMHSEILAQFLPERVKGYNDYWLSNLWGYSKKYVNTLKNELKSKPNKKIKDTSIKKLEVNLKEELGAKAFTCTSIVKSYKAGELTPLQFLEDLRQELGRITSKIPVTLEELGLILVDSTRYITGVWDKLKYPSRKNFNPNYMFTIERLEQFKENIKARLGVNANKCLELIDKYKKANLDLKEYKNQQFTIKNPKIFQKLDNTEKLYWFGFLCADGWLIKETNRKYYRIGIELSKKDLDRIRKFTEFVGLPLDRIKYRIKYTKDKSGNLTANEMVYTMFGCKLMYFDLEKKGLRDATSHTDPKIKKVPSIIYNLINNAKEEALQGQYELNEIESINLRKSKRWYYTKSGKLALAWLLGFYDGDGHYGGGRRASIASSSKTFLESVKRVFLSKNSVRIYEKSKYLTLGPDLFDAMIWSYNKSMPRKRPLSKQGNNSTHN